jgi:hypothetical protein
VKCIFLFCFAKIFVHLAVYLLISHLLSLPCARNQKCQNEYILLFILKKFPVMWRKIAYLNLLHLKMLLNLRCTVSLLIAYEDKRNTAKCTRLLRPRNFVFGGTGA